MNDVQRFNFITRPLFLMSYFLAMTLHNSYTADLTEKEQSALIGRLPTILADICRQNPSGADEKELISMLSTGSNNSYIMREPVAIILRKFDSQGNYIFPKTVLRVAQEYLDVYQGKYVLYQRYDKKTEIKYGIAFMNRFPSELKAVCNIEKHITKKLVICAYILENKFDIRKDEPEAYLIEQFGHFSPGSTTHDCIEHYIYCKFQNNNPLVKRLTQEFIKIFSNPAIPHQTSSPPSAMPSNSTTIPVTIINQCRENILKNCCIEDTYQRSLALASFEACYTELITKATSENMEQQQKLCDPQFVQKQLQESLPTCPICFELFSDQFTNDSNGAAYTTPCKHIICTACLPKCNSTCPLCRQKLS